jgi:hypothetical protein
MIDVVDIAVAQVGVAEKPGNKGLPFERYGLPGEDPLPWCARFVRWCFAQAGHTLPGNPYEIASVTNLEAALEAAGAWLGRKAIPRRGDLLLLNARGQSDAGRGGRHIGIVTSSDSTWVRTVEGNWGDKVARVQRRLDDETIAGYGRWPKDPEA